MPQDKNRKEIGVGDEVTVHFRVRTIRLLTDGYGNPVCDEAVLETVHNAFNETTRDPLPSDPFVTCTQRVILQRGRAKTET